MKESTLPESENVLHDDSDRPRGVQRTTQVSSVMTTAPQVMSMVASSVGMFPAMRMATAAACST